MHFWSKSGVSGWYPEDCYDCRAPAVLKIRKRWVTELGTYVLDLSTGMKVTLKFNQRESEVKKPEWKCSFHCFRILVQQSCRELYPASKPWQNKLYFILLTDFEKSQSIANVHDCSPYHMGAVYLKCYRNPLVSTSIYEIVISES